MFVIIFLSTFSCFSKYNGIIPYKIIEISTALVDGGLIIDAKTCKNILLSEFPTVTKFFKTSPTMPSLSKCSPTDLMGRSLASTPSSVTNCGGDAFFSISITLSIISTLPGILTVSISP